jgi:hypothetical protein
MRSPPEDFPLHPRAALAARRWAALPTGRRPEVALAVRLRTEAPAEHHQTEASEIVIRTAALWELDLATACEALFLL